MKFKKKLFGDPVANQHIAEITGLSYHHRPYAWTRGGQSFSHISGGIALPSFDVPGYLLAIGVRHNTPGHIDCLVELESDDEMFLMDKAQAIQKEYGAGVIENWWGDPGDLMSLVNERHGDNPVLVSSPVDSDQPDYFQICVSRLRVALRSGHKTLNINECNILRNSILSFIKDKQAKAGNNPVLIVAGGLVHTMLMIRPWEQAVESKLLVPTTTEDYAAYAQKKALEGLYDEVFD